MEQIYIEGILEHIQTSDKLTDELNNILKQSSKFNKLFLRSSI